jgi:uncharacterized membrane protein YphA (DoxX/SURF4 family)
LKKLKDYTLKNRLTAIKTITAVFMLLGFLMTFKVWFLQHDFPVIKVLNSIPVLGSQTTVIIFILLLLSTAMSIFWHHSNIYILIILLSVVLLSQDYMRWQPWIYMYLLIFWIVSRAKKGNRQQLIWALQLLLAGIYFWAGAHKINPYFRNTLPLDMAQNLGTWFQGLSPEIIYKITYLGYLIPIIEMGIGIGLLFKKYRYFALITASITHIFIIMFQAPHGFDYFGIVYPWNIAMLLIIWLLFYYDDSLISVKEIKKSLLLKIITLLIWFFPALNIFGLWHNYTSFKLYTGNDRYLFAIVNKADLNNSLKLLKPYQFEVYKQLNTQFNLSENEKIISFYHWAIGTYHLPLNLNNAAQKKLIKYIENYKNKLKQPVRFVIYEEGRYKLLNTKNNQ